MIRHTFNSDWTVAAKHSPFEAFTGPAGAAPEPPVAVTLPHDAVRDLPRSADSANGSHTGYFPGGWFRYEKTLDIPEGYRERTVEVEFEGVYRDATVFVNGALAARRPSGYAGFVVDLGPYLRFGGPNLIAVECRTHQDSRWYTGAGIYRDTHLAVAAATNIPLDGVRVTTEYIEQGRAEVEVEVEVRNQTRSTRTLRVTTDLAGPDGVVVATGNAPLTLLPNTSGIARLRLSVHDALLWDVDHPDLYTAHTRLTEGGDLVDEDRTTFGIRIVRVDAVAGLRINGVPVDLKGACVHHDNGPLGGATIARAEERRVQLLKAAGFTAIRSSHNPLSRAMLDACDRFGMLVMDEFSDVWTQAKTGFDYSTVFTEWWERDLRAMVRKDFNHPSVILYSIGNEIMETGNPVGSAWGRSLVDALKADDRTRPVTNAINPTVSVFDTIAAMMAAAGQAQDVNSAMTSMGEALSQLVVSDLVTDAIEEAASQVDVVGLNYADARYELDARLFPNRVLVGSETNPADIDRLWGLVSSSPHVIGDFTWTGWDYLGESGIGRVEYTDEPGYRDNGLSAAYPYLTATAGDIDITGHRRTVSYYREIVFGGRQEPYIAVHRPQSYGRPSKTSNWSWSDSVSTWTWNAAPGSPVRVDVYTDADEVELLLDGSTIARQAVGAEKSFIATFDTAYAPGTLTAVAYADGRERGRTELRTALGETGLAVAADRDEIRADDTDLAFVEVSLRDPSGVLVTDTDRRLTVTVTGAGRLAGVASGRPATEEAFASDTWRTYDGRLLAVVRPDRAGDIDVRVEGDGLETVSLRLTAS
jgi:beta-galactosidase